MTPLSRTRALMGELRERLLLAAPIPPPAPPARVPEPPVRVFPRPHRRTRLADEAALVTTALVGIGRVGTRYATNVVLQFQAELAVAHAAVAAELPPGWAEAQGLLSLRSRVADHREFLLRPDLGRRLAPESLELLRAHAIRDVDVQPILADGLSASACMRGGPALLASLTAACRARGMTVGVPLCAQFARVWLEDEIGQEVRARVAVILLGERPGLGTGDGLSAYMVHGPAIGRTDGDRNMISNIHARGVAPDDAADRLARLAEAMIAQGRSGVDLDLAALANTGVSATALRAPSPRLPLVEVP